MIKSKPVVFSQAIVLSALLISGAAQATIFLPQDPRALGMGGASVSIANSSQALYYNPSLLHNARENEDFNFEIDAAVRVSDTENFINALNDFGEQNLILDYTTNFNTFNTSLSDSLNNMSAFSSALANFNDNSDPLQTADLLNALESARTNLTTSLASLSTSSLGLSSTTRGLNSALEGVSGKHLIFDVTAGLSTSVPNMEKISWGFFANGWGTLSINAQYAAEDGATITGVANSLEELGSTVAIINTSLSGNVEDTDADAIEEQITLLTNSLDFFAEDSDGDGTPDNNFTNGLQSSVIASGGLIREIGVSLATNYAISGYEFDVGVTPKFVMVDATDYTLTLSDETSGEDAKFDISDIKSYNSFNADIGVSKVLSENWKTGLVIKNIIPYSYKTPSKNSAIKISPAVRVGASYQNNWVSIAADLDLTENEAIGGLAKSRFLSLGAEADVWLLKLRAGYRADLSTGSAVPSLGFGLYLAGLNVDAAIAANSFEIPTNEEGFRKFDDISASLRIGIQW